MTDRAMRAAAVLTARGWDLSDYATKRCAQCGTDCVAGATYCHQCGARQPDRTESIDDLEAAIAAANQEPTA